MTDTPPRLLLVDDDAQLAAMLHEFLEMHGFKVDVIADGESALTEIAANQPDLVILDVMLPGMNGFDVLQQLRLTHNLPVIMLTARGEEPDRILGLMHGADDYLPKPFNPLELTARIKAVLKRSGGSIIDNTEDLVTGPLKLCLRRREFSVRDKIVPLTAAEMRVMEQFLRHPDNVMSRAQLTELALDRSIEAYDRSIDTLVSKLRRKLSAAGVDKNCIRGLRGHGYVLDSELIANG